jgi:UDP-galactopyranose mutase
MAQYDYLIVGAGLFGAVFAHEARQAGKKVLVIDRRNHIGGNVYTEDWGGIPVHRYGAHIFHTDDEEVWRYVQQFARFNRFTNAPLAKYGNELYHLPFNMNTFYQMWGVVTPAEARAVIDEQKKEITGEPRNLEEQAISLVGRDVYTKLIKGYTEKQWGRECKDLPAFIIRRLPVRCVYDNNYFNDRFQGIPAGGYTLLVQRMLEGAEVLLNTDFEAVRGLDLADTVVYTGPIDAYYGYRFGELAYRSLRFETEDLQGVNDYQGNAVINYTEAEVPYTRLIEHKHFAYDQP